MSTGGTEATERALSLSYAAIRIRQL